MALLCITLLPRLLHKQRPHRGRMSARALGRQGEPGHRMSSTSFLTGKNGGPSEPIILDQAPGLGVPACAKSAVLLSCYWMASLLPLRSFLPRPLLLTCLSRPVSGQHRKASPSTLSASGYLSGNLTARHSFVSVFSRLDY